MDALIVAGLASGLAFVGEKILDKIADAGLGPIDEQFKAWLHKDYEAAKKADQLRKATMEALDRALAETLSSFDKLKLTNKITGRSAETYSLLAAAAVEISEYDPKAVPDRLLQALEMEEVHRELLGRFLYYLRQRLSKEAGYDQLIQYADRLVGRGLLKGLSQDVANIAEDTHRAVSLLELLRQERRLTGNDPQALEDYLAYVRQEWGNLMLPLIRKQSGDTRPVSLRQIFIPLYVRDERAEAEAQRKATREMKRGEVREKLADEQVKPVNFNELLGRYNRFILIGSPGCGKTTLLRRAALAFAENRAAEDLGWGGKPLLPIFLRLRHLGVFLSENHDRYPHPSSGALVACLEQYLKQGERIELPNDFFDRRLQEGGCIVLLDGLDEVSQNRIEVAQHVCAFIEKYKVYQGNCFGLSSRPKGYEHEVRIQLAAADLALAEVRPLDPGGIRQLIANLLVLLEGNLQVRERDIESLSRAILSNPQLTEIAGTPLFCAALVQVYKYHGAELPQRRVDVLAEIVDLLLGHWHAQQRVPEAHKLAQEDGTDRLYRDVKDAVDHKLRRLSHLAFYMVDQAHQAEIKAETAQLVLAEYLQQRERVSDAEKAWRWAQNFLANSHERSGLLVETNPDTYAFVHLNFLEYLAATALANRPSQLVPTVLSHLDDSWWEQVILLTGAHDKTPDETRENMICEMLDLAQAQEYGESKWVRALTMAGWLARDMGGHLAGPEHQAVEDALYQAMTDPDLSPKTRADLADVLDALWLPPDLATFIPIGTPPQFWIGKYPVTNAQYQRFLEAPDFAEKGYWSAFPKYSEPENYTEIGDWGEEGWKWLQARQQDKDDSPDGKRVLPRYWNDPRLGISRRGVPVVGITWYEANAYCKWLQVHWAELEEAQLNPFPALREARLPLEHEWEQAAGGIKPEGRYAWDEPGKATSEKQEIIRRANVDVSGIDRTTPVGMYLLGASRNGIFDLSGNVWEWQANYSSESRKYLALRGGSWLNHLSSARVSERYHYAPDDSWLDSGFRVVVFPS
jgi:formylglycine-generating enzyme required for sulfatase activity